MHWGIPIPFWGMYQVISFFSLAVCFVHVEFCFSVRLPELPPFQINTCTLHSIRPECFDELIVLWVKVSSLTVLASLGKPSFAKIYVFLHIVERRIKKFKKYEINLLHY